MGCWIWICDIKDACSGFQVAASIPYHLLRWPKVGSTSLRQSNPTSHCSLPWDDRETTHMSSQVWAFALLLRSAFIH